MRKIFLSCLLLALTSLTVHGQLLTPKRIIFEGDTGIFFKKYQEVPLLTIIKERDYLKKENKLLLDYQINCDKQIKIERAAFDSLYVQYGELTNVANEFKLKYENEWVLHQQTQAELAHQIGLKTKWRRWTIGLGTGNLVLGGVLYLIIAH